MQYVSSMPSTRLDVINLQEKLDQQLQQRQVLMVPVSPLCSMQLDFHRLKQSSVSVRRLTAAWRILAQRQALAAAAVTAHASASWCTCCCVA